MNWIGFLVLGYLLLLLLLQKVIRMALAVIVQTVDSDHIDKFREDWLTLVKQGLGHPSLRVKCLILVGLFFGVVLAPVFLLQVLHQKISEGRNRTKGSFSLKILDLFRWFCRDETRAVVELSMADIQRDIRQMKKKNYRSWVISAVVIYRTGGTILPILYDGTLRALERLSPFLLWFWTK